MIHGRSLKPEILEVMQITFESQIQERTGVNLETGDNERMTGLT